MIDKLLQSRYFGSAKRFNQLAFEGFVTNIAKQSLENISTLLRAYNHGNYFFRCVLKAEDW